MNKFDLVEKVARETGVSKKVAEEVINCAIAVVKEAVADGAKVSVRGFGTMEAVERAPRRGYNIISMQTMDIPSTKTVRFRPSESFKEIL